MKSIPLKQLIQISPIDQATKQKTLEQLPKLNEIQKLKLYTTLWKSISLMYQSFVKEKLDAMLDEMAHGKAVYEKEDFKNAEAEIFNKLLVKIDETQSQEDVEALQAQLKTK